MNIGYVRVSDKDQNPDRQIEKMKALDIDERFIYVDKASGKDFNRPQFQTMRDHIRAGDVIYIDALDRLGRTYDGIIKEWRCITRELNADIVVLDQESLFDSRKFKSMGDLGKLLEDQFLSLLSYVAAQERNKIRRRQREGIDLALKEKRPYGRPKVVITEKFRKAWMQWKAGKITAVKAMELADVKKDTFYRNNKRLEEEYKGNPLFPNEDK